MWLFATETTSKPALQTRQDPPVGGERVAALGRRSVAGQRRLDVADRDLRRREPLASGWSGSAGSSAPAARRPAGPSMMSPTAVSVVTSGTGSVQRTCERIAGRVTQRMPTGHGQHPDPRVDRVGGHDRDAVAVADRRAPARRRSRPAVSTCIAAAGLTDLGPPAATVGDDCPGPLERHIGHRSGRVHDEGQRHPIRAGRGAGWRAGSAWGSASGGWRRSEVDVAAVGVGVGVGSPGAAAVQPGSRSAARMPSPGRVRPISPGRSKSRESAVGPSTGSGNELDGGASPYFSPAAGPRCRGTGRRPVRRRTNTYKPVVTRSRYPQRQIRSRSIPLRSATRSQ